MLPTCDPESVVRSGRRQNRSASPAETPQSAEPFENPRVTAPVSFSVLRSLNSAPTRSSRGSSWPGAGAVDRKSTRLNSSHLVISYAVFCLKKKKKKQANHYETRVSI